MHIETDLVNKIAIFDLYDKSTFFTLFTIFCFSHDNFLKNFILDLDNPLQIKNSY